MEESNATKKYKKRYKELRLGSETCLLGPLVMYMGIAFANGTATQRTTLTLTIVTCIIFTLLNFVFKYHIRSTVWILLLGIHACVNNISALLFMIATTTMFDEFVLTPLWKKYKQKYIINKEIDERSDTEGGA